MRGRCKTSLAVLVVAMLSTQPVTAQTAACAAPADINAFVVRDLQSRLMVAGLACGQRASYNAFVAVHESELGQAGQRLMSYFRKNANGVRSVDAHVTRAANVASLRHSEDRDSYCAQTAQLFRQLLGESKRSLVQVAQAARLKAVAKPVICTAKAPAETGALVTVQQTSAAD